MDREKQLQKLLNMKTFEGLMPFLMGVIEQEIPGELAKELGLKFGDNAVAALKIEFLEGLQALRPIAIKIQESTAKDNELKNAAPGN